MYLVFTDAQIAGQVNFPLSGIKQNYLTGADNLKAISKDAPCYRSSLKLLAEFYSRLHDLCAQFRETEEADEYRRLEEQYNAEAQNF